ncbi:MAG: beta-lactamase family protein [Acidobacteriota bacterium]|nr:beta-lactamase family protein [Acidobacteriota bacterium]
MLRRTASTLAAVALAVSLVGYARESPRLPDAAPAAAGFSAERLQRLHTRLQTLIDEGHFSGFVTLIARNGSVVDVRSLGLRDREASLPMERDTIFRIYSMSKIVTSVAALMLVEEGRLRLNDPIGQYLPALTEPKVFTGRTEGRPMLVRAKAPITVRHLFTHSSGYGYGFGQAPIDRLYHQADLFSAPTMTAFLERAARLPLAEEPGQRFRYGINTDLLGAIVEKVSGQPFEAFVRDRITGPLRMQDTAFVVPAEKRSRLAVLYAKDKAGRLAIPQGPLLATSKPVKDPLPYPDAEGRGFPSGGGGLFSTIDDYARFGQMLLNGGELDGVRLLGRKTVQSMRSNHLLFLDRPTTDNGADGFGLGGAVRRHLAHGGPLGSPGQFGWSGAASTYFNIDPEEGTMALLFAQHFPHNEHDVFSLFSTMMYAALVDAPKR